MLRFVFKKYFSDLWANFIPLVVINLGILAPALLGFSFASLESFPKEGVLYLVIGGSLGTLFLLTAAGPYTWGLADYRKARKKDFLPNLAKGWGDAFWGYGLGIFIGLAVWVAVPFYLNRMEGIGGILAAGLVMALGLVAALSLPYYFAVRYQRNLSGIKAYREVLLYLLKNPFPSLILALVPLALGVLAVSGIQFVILRDPAGVDYFSNMGFSLVLGLSVFSLMFLPGPAGILLLFQNAYRIGILGVTYRETQGKNLGFLPWKEILAKEADLLGTRSTARIIRRELD